MPREGKAGADEGFGRGAAGMEHVRWAPQLRVGSNDTGPPPAQPETELVCKCSRELKSIASLAAGVPTVEPLAAWIQAARRVNFNGG